MKKLLLLSLLALGILACKDTVQDELSPQVPNAIEVPTAVVQTMKREFPKATNISYVAVSANELWESDFKIDGADHDALIDVKGNLLEANAQSDEVKLPDAAKTYIETNYKGYTVVTVSEGKAAGKTVGYKVLLRKDKEDITVLFDEKGVFTMEFKATAPATPVKVTLPQIKIYAIALKDLPKEVASALTDREFVKGFVTVDRNGNKTYSITAKKGTTFYEMVIDAKGKVLKEFSYIFEPKVYSYKELKATDLPAVITDYLNKTYKTWAFTKGTQTLINGKSENYVIVVKVNDKDTIYLYFDADGKFQKAQTITIVILKIEEKTVKTEELPKVVKDYLDKNYKGWTLEKGIAYYLNNDLTSYMLLIVVDKTKYYVSFNDDGKFLGAKKG